MKKIAYIICLINLALLLLVPLTAWLLSVLNFDVVNLVSEEGIRWLFSHGGKALLSYQLTMVVFLLSAVGVLQESGLAKDIASKHLHKRAFYVSSAFFSICFILLLLPTVIPQNALLGVTGSLLPSPWMMGFPLALCLNVIVSGIIYASIKGTLNGFMDIPRMITIGISKYSIWIVDVMMITLIVRLIKFCLL